MSVSAFKGSVVGDGMRHSVQREAEVQSKLRHPNIVRMMGFFQDPTKVHFVLEYAPGGDVFKVRVRMFALAGRARSEALLFCIITACIIFSLKVQRLP